MLRASDADLGSEFLRHMQQSVEVYEDLAQLTDRTYRNANDLMGRHWKREGLTEFRNDLATQRAWLAAFQKPKSVTFPGGAVRIEAEAMAGPWRIGNDRYPGFSGTGYAASYYAAVCSAPDPLTAKVHVPKAGEYTVWVRALLGGSHQERALAVELTGPAYDVWKQKHYDWWHAYYHASYQYNPFSGDRWGADYSLWGHATSTDLVHWQNRDWALLPRWDQRERRCNSGRPSSPKAAASR